MLTLTSEQAENLLRQSKLKVTLPRLQILLILGHSDQLMTASDIEMKCLKDGQFLHLHTIYSTLRKLIEIGIVTEFKLNDNKASFVLSSRYIPHKTTCIQCGQTNTVQDTRIQKLLLEVSQVQGFELHRYALSMSVTCSICLQEKLKQAGNL